MMSDAFKIEEVDDFVYEVNCRLMMGKLVFGSLGWNLESHLKSFFFVSESWCRG